MQFMGGMVTIMDSAAFVLSFPDPPEVGVEALVGGLVGGMALPHGVLNFESLFQVCCLLYFIQTRNHPDAMPHLYCAGEKAYLAATILDFSSLL